MSRRISVCRKKLPKSVLIQAQILSCELASSEFVSVKVLDVLGRESCDTRKRTATTGNIFGSDGAPRGWPSGVYFYRLRAGEFVEKRR